MPFGFYDGNDVNIGTPDSIGIINSVSTAIRYDDMNASNGGVARVTAITQATWVDVYLKTGAGYIFSWLLNLENSGDWLVRFIVDGIELFTSTGLLSDDVLGDSIYDLDNDFELSKQMGLSYGSHERIIWNCPCSIPLKYTTSVNIKIKRVTGKANKNFRAGLIVLTR